MTIPRSCPCCAVCPDCAHHDEFYDIGEFDPPRYNPPCGKVSPFTNMCPEGRCTAGFDAAMCQRKWRLKHEKEQSQTDATVETAG